jgi:Putative zinc-finger
MAEEITYSKSGELQKKYTVCKEFIRVMHLVLDGEANEEEEAFLKNHISSSKDCLKHFDGEKDFRQFFKEKCACIPIQKDVIERIKAKLASFQIS